MAKCAPVRSKFDPYSRAGQCKDSLNLLANTLHTRKSRVQRHGPPPYQVHVVPHRFRFRWTHSLIRAYLSRSFDLPSLSPSVPTSPLQSALTCRYAFAQVLTSIVRYFIQRSNLPVFHIGRNSRPEVSRVFVLGCRAMETFACTISALCIPVPPSLPFSILIKSQDTSKPRPQGLKTRPA